MNNTRRISVNTGSFFDDGFFDNFFKTTIHPRTASPFPPYDILKIDEETYQLNMAVAGFSEDEIDISLKGPYLHIQGEKKAGDKKSYIHQGIAHRSWERKFNLNDHVEVSGCALDSGILTIFFKRNIPESQRVRKIEIGAGTPTLLNETDTHTRPVSF